MSKTKQICWNIAALLCLLIFIVIAFSVATKSQLLTTIDTPIINLVRGHITSLKTTFFTSITVLGNTKTIIAITIIVAAIFYFYRQQKAAIWLLINIVFIQGALNWGLKHTFNRPRPSVEHLVSADGTSFPSGHSMGSMLLFGTIILVLPKLISNKPIRVLCQILLAILILLIGTSRIYVGVHYPTDIIGGYSFGAFWLCLSYPIYKKSASKPQLRRR